MPQIALWAFLFSIFYFLFQEDWLVALALLSLFLTVIILAACALSHYRGYSIIRDERQAKHDFKHNPFRQDLTFRTFPQIIVPERPKADLTIIHPNQFKPKPTAA